MLFLDLDLDFFLNKNVYYSGYDGTRPGPQFKPWRISTVRNFLEDRCGLSLNNPLPGRTVATHDGVLEFWRVLIDSGKLVIPFKVVHIDAHPDLWVGDLLFLKADFLHFNIKNCLKKLKEKRVHAGNYLTFAIVYGWVGSLVWVPLLKYRKTRDIWDADARTGLLQLQNNENESHIRDSPVAEKGGKVYFEILPWNRFRTSEPFDYIALSKSPDFTPPGSDTLIPVIEEYMNQI